MTRVGFEVFERRRPVALWHTFYQI